MLSALRKIRPLRGWRAFVGEVGVIVLGVLIAVGIGKVVETLDWRDRVATARATLNQDIEDDLFSAHERIAATPCLLRQLDCLRTQVLDERHGTARATTTIAANGQPTVYVHPTRSWSAATWSAVVSDNIPAHMPVSQRTGYETLYTFMPIVAAINIAETEDENDLSLLAEPIALDRRARIELLRAIARERGRAGMLNLMSRQIIAYIRELGIDTRLPADAWTAMNTVTWCRAQRLL